MKNNKILRKSLAGYGIFLISSVVALLIVGNVLAGTYSNLISTIFQQSTTKKIEIDNKDEINTDYFTSNYSSQTELYNAEVDFATKIQAEGSVLLQNKGLPIAEKGNITLLGSSISKKAFLVSGGGSGSIDTAQTPTLKEVFENEGYKINSAMWDFYNTGAGKNTRSSNTVGEPVTSTIIDADKYSDAAIIVISRLGSENLDVATTTIEDSSKHMLELSKNELDLIDLSIKTFGKGKVVVLLNTLNAMELGPLMEKDVSIMWICAGGQQGLRALPGLLNGKYNPSGKLVDTYVYDNFSSPAMVNFGDFNYANYIDSFGSQKYLIYQEGIYVGYKYYETRYEDKILNANGVGDYDYSKTVTYPFGYGLSYTTFKYSNYKVNESKEEYTINVDVENTGSKDGKAVVEIYLQKPYIENGIEIASVELVGFAKTETIKAQKTQNMTVSFPKEYLRSYNEKLNNGEGGYILNEGDYYISLGTDAHNAINNILSAKGKTTSDGMTENGNTNFVYKFNLSAEKTEEYAKKFNNGKKQNIKNQLSDIDITKYDSSYKYLSRSNWTNTWPKIKDLNATTELINAMSDYYPNIENAKMPTTGAEQIYGLVDMKGLDYDSKEWETLLNQLTISDMQKLICNGAYGTPNIPSISKDTTLDKDGPAGISATLIGGKGTFGFPVETLIASTWNIELAKEMGSFIGEDALLADVSGWYAPGLNMHRTPFSGRNFEYYSEDSFLTGLIGANVTKAAQEKGVYTYSKHFALNDEELNRQSVCVFSNEQAAREIYLRPFEINVRDGNSKGIMVSMNRIGGSWTGGHKGLVTEILRNEWGFIGCVVTDASSIGSTQNGLYAGTDLWLGSGNGSFCDNWQNNAGVITMMRNACHNILYTIANSNAMNGIAPGTLFIPVITPWQIALLSIDVLLGLTSIYGISAIFYFSFIKKDNEKKEEL